MKLKRLKKLVHDYVFNGSGLTHSSWGHDRGVWSHGAMITLANKVIIT
jgi:hypothetical protein